MAAAEICSGRMKFKRESCDLGRHPATCDVKIICKDGTAFAHQAIMGLHSKLLKDYFEEMCQIAVRSGDQVLFKIFLKRSILSVFLPDVEKRQMDLLLDIMYTGKTKSIDKEGDVEDERLKLLDLYQLLQMQYDETNAMIAPQQLERICLNSGREAGGTAPQNLRDVEDQPLSSVFPSGMNPSNTDPRINNTHRPSIESHEDLTSIASLSSLLDQAGSPDLLDLAGDHISTGSGGGHTNGLLPPAIQVQRSGEASPAAGDASGQSHSLGLAENGITVSPNGGPSGNNSETEPNASVSGRNPDKRSQNNDATDDDDILFLGTITKTTLNGNEDDKALIKKEEDENVIDTEELLSASNNILGSSGENADESSPLDASPGPQDEDNSPWESKPSPILRYLSDTDEDEMYQKYSSLRDFVAPTGDRPQEKSSNAPTRSDSNGANKHVKKKTNSKEKKGGSTRSRLVKKPGSTKKMIVDGKKAPSKAKVICALFGNKRQSKGQDKNTTSIVRKEGGETSDDDDLYVPSSRGQSAFANNSSKNVAKLPKRNLRPTVRLNYESDSDSSLGRLLDMDESDEADFNPKDQSLDQPEQGGNSLQRTQPDSGVLVRSSNEGSRGRDVTTTSHKENKSRDMKKGKATKEESKQSDANACDVSVKDLLPWSDNEDPDPSSMSDRGDIDGTIDNDLPMFHSPKPWESLGESSNSMERNDAALGLFDEPSQGRKRKIEDDRKKNRTSTPKKKQQEPRRNRADSQDSDAGSPSEKKYKCAFPQCTKRIYTHRDSLIGHLIFHHLRSSPLNQSYADVEDQKGPRNCTLCKRRMSNVKMLLVHRAIHHQDLEIRIDELLARDLNNEFDTITEEEKESCKVIKDLLKKIGLYVGNRGRKSSLQEFRDSIESINFETIDDSQSPGPSRPQNTCEDDRQFSRAHGHSRSKSTGEGSSSSQPKSKSRSSKSSEKSQKRSNKKKSVRIRSGLAEERSWCSICKKEDEMYRKDDLLKHIFLNHLKDRYDELYTKADDKFRCINCERCTRSQNMMLAHAVTVHPKNIYIMASDLLDSINSQDNSRDQANRKRAKKTTSSGQASRKKRRVNLDSTLSSEPIGPPSPDSSTARDFPAEPEAGPSSAGQQSSNRSKERSKIVTETSNGINHEQLENERQRDNECAEVKEAADIYLLNTDDENSDHEQPGNTDEDTGTCKEISKEKIGCETCNETCPGRDPVAIHIMFIRVSREESITSILYKVKPSIHGFPADLDCRLCSDFTTMSVIGMMHHVLQQHRKIFEELLNSCDHLKFINPLLTDASEDVGKKNKSAESEENPGEGPSTSRSGASVDAGKGSPHQIKCFVCEREVGPAVASTFPQMMKHMVDSHTCSHPIVVSQILLQLLPIHNHPVTKEDKDGYKTTSFDMAKEDDISKKIRLYSCGSCAFTSTNRNAMESHVKEHLRKENVQMCPECLNFQEKNKDHECSKIVPKLNKWIIDTRKDADSSIESKFEVTVKQEVLDVHAIAPPPVFTSMPCTHRVRGCTALFFNKKDMRDHVQRCSMKPSERFICEGCQKRFYYKADHDGHVKNHCKKLAKRQQGSQPKP